MKALIFAVLWLWAQGPSPAGQQAPPQDSTQASEPGSYILGPRDVLKVTIFNEEQLSRDSVPIEMDGTIEYPLVGRVRVGGLTTRQVEQELIRLLGTRTGPDGKLTGYLRNPQITVSVRDYRTVRVWVMGQVVRQGSHELQGGRATLMDAIAEAGGFSSTAGRTVSVVRGSGSEGSGPTLPTSAPARNQIQVSREDIDSGVATVIRLRDGDTVFVSKADEVFVTGQVKSPNKYVMTEKMTVLQAITLAGGYTDRAAKNRIEIQREVNGRKEKFRVKETDLVQPGDTIIVPSRRL
jgi:polysaccharide export outer membrane protein